MKQMIPQIKRILYATDLSDNSAYVFRYAIDSAKKCDAGIINTLLGSSSKRVLRRTRKPVLIIPLPKEEANIDLGDV